MHLSSDHKSLGRPAHALPLFHMSTSLIVQPYVRNLAREGRPPACLCAWGMRGPSPAPQLNRVVGCACTPPVCAPLLQSEARPSSAYQSDQNVLVSLCPPQNQAELVQSSCDVEAGVPAHWDDIRCCIACVHCTFFEVQKCCSLQCTLESVTLGIHVTVPRRYGAACLACCSSLALSSDHSNRCDGAFHRHGRLLSG